MSYLIRTSKEIVRDRIRSLLTTYPGNTAVVTSRIVGYDNPFQFDRSEFRHFRVTRLALKEIEQFVHDWYMVRVENVKERERNALDLTRIVRDKNHLAIRELAENPLLLTIVALVHRIDAVLPDERVVLYQKCTETLLNTWHKWKYKDAEEKGKGRIDRKHRQRVQAIANWMHQRSTSSEGSQRAVVPYRDLQQFLSEYIRSNENISQDEDADDLSVDFIEFVKKRAGLLIEVGDNLYSFVHLTFQEFLTASFIITRHEKDGAIKIWSTIRSHVADPRWNEVIRLLIAALESDASQEFLIQKLLAQENSRHPEQISLLLSGLLMDSVEPAEQYQESIISQLMLYAAQASDSDRLSPLISRLRSWRDKADENEQVILGCFKDLLETLPDITDRTALSLVAIALGSPIEDVFLEKSKCIDNTVLNDFAINLLLKKGKDLAIPPELAPKIDILMSLQDSMALISSSTNLVASLIEPLVCAFTSEYKAKRTFEQQLLLFSAYIGPFCDFNFNILMETPEADSSIRSWAKDTLSYHHAQRVSGTEYQLHPSSEGIVNLNHTGMTIDHSLLPANLKSKHRFFKQISKLIMVEKSSLAKARLQSLLSDLNETVALSNYQDLIGYFSAFQLFGGSDVFTNTVLVNTSEAVDTFSEILCDCLKLNPYAHWKAAIKSQYYSVNVNRIDVFDFQKSEAIISRFTDDSFTQADIYTAAWQLIFDIWLYMFGFYKDTGASIFDRLAVKTYNNQAPPLIIAHCLREFAYGDSKQLKKLSGLVSSNEDDYRGIFERCLWKATESEHERFRNLLKPIEQPRSKVVKNSH